MSTKAVIKPKTAAAMIAQLAPYLGENMDLRDQRDRAIRLLNFYAAENRLLRQRVERWREIAMNAR
jgi:hypothetical protein